MTLLRIIVFLLGIIFFLIVIAVGYATAVNPSPVIVASFGVVSALLAPIGFSAVGFAFRGNEATLARDLAKVPQIEQLIKEAKTQEEKIRLLEKQHKQLLEQIQLEARKQMLASRKTSLEDEATRIFYELNAIEEQAFELEMNLESEVVSEAIQQLKERIDARQRGDLVFKIGKYEFIVDSKYLIASPGGIYIEVFLQVLASILKRLF